MDSQLLYLSRADVEKVGPPMGEIIAAVEAVFRERGEDRVDSDDTPQMEYYRSIGYFAEIPTGSTSGPAPKALGRDFRSEGKRPRAISPQRSAPEGRRLMDGR